MKVMTTKRNFIKTALIGAAGLFTTFKGIGTAHARDAVSHSISVRNYHTGESFSGPYKIGKYYLPKAFKQINHVMRDHRTDDMHPIDPKLIDILANLQQQCSCTQPIDLLSGYRSPKTNAMLRSRSKNVAKNSYHMKGQAADIQIPGSSTNKVRKIAMGLRRGGVGYYPKSSFVHVDTGDVRNWTA